MGPCLSSTARRRKQSEDPTTCPPTPEQVAQAMSLKDLGNEHFKAGKYKEAEQLYSQAIQQNPTDPKLFTNRALARIRIQDWEGAEYDSRKAVEIYTSNKRENESMKSYFYLAQALSSLRHHGEALEHAKHAYKICLKIQDSSAEVLSQFILRTKQAIWQGRETARLRELNSTLAAVEVLLDQQLERDIAEVEEKFAKSEIGQTGRDEEKAELEKEATERRRNVREVFKDPARAESAERVVPDYLVDGITFEIMHDPVVTPSGVSYERISILRHIRASPLDPLTREPLQEAQLIPNVGLKNACAEFVENNGWAVDY